MSLTRQLLYEKIKSLPEEKLEKMLSFACFLEQENETTKIILHVLKASEWNEQKHLDHYGNHWLASDGFIHCSDVHTIQNVVWMFLNASEPLVILCIDVSKVQAEIKWENGGSTDYPHIYGLLNTDAVINVLPFLKDESDQFVLNPELQKYVD